MQNTQSTAPGQMIALQPISRVLPCAFLLVISGLIGFASSTASAQSAAPSEFAANEITRPHYQIDLAIDVEHRLYCGSERVLWLNNGDHGTSVIFFHLYSNVRTEPQPPVAQSSAPDLQADEPRIEVTEVKTAAAVPLLFSLDDQGTTLRVNLREAIQPGKSVEVVLNFKGAVPEIDPEETGLVTHIIKQVSAAIKSEREMRRAREINFRSRNLMFLGTAFPVLVVHDGDEWRRRIDAGVGDLLFSEAADYDVTIHLDSAVPVFTSAPEVSSSSDQLSRKFAANALRDLVILAGANLRAEQKVVGKLTVQSIYLAEHERIGRRVLANAADAAKIFQERFGPLPFKTVSIVEAPLIAGLGSIEFSAFSVIASAFYVDFESAAMRNMPELIRDQRASVEDSLEWTVAHLMAHEWWGAVVGSDPAREPVLDEAMAGWSALLYYRLVYGAERADAVMQDQLRGVYRLYRTFGGEDLPADRPSRDYRNSFQYAAIVMTKGALMFVKLEKELGEKSFYAAVQKYYQANSLEIAQTDDLRAAFVAEARVEQRRMVARTFNRWLSNRRGDEDIGLPDRQLADSLGLPAKADAQRGADHSAFTVFGKLGKFFWQQMTRIR